MQRDTHSTERHWWRRCAVVLPAVLLFAILPATVALAGRGEPTVYDRPFGNVQGLGQLADAIYRFGIVLVVIAAAIYMGIGAFAYFVAAGNAAMAEKGKQIISRCLIGLLLALISWVLLNTISPQFTELKEPEFNLGRAGGGGAGGPGGFGGGGPVLDPNAGIPNLPVQQIPAAPIADRNIVDLRVIRQLVVEQTGPNTFRFPKDTNPQPLTAEDVRSRIQTLIDRGELRRGDQIVIAPLGSVTPTPGLYGQLRDAVSPQGLRLIAPGIP